MVGMTTPFHPEDLTRAECLDLLRRASLGRIGVSSGALPHVEPVHFRLVGDEVVLRVGQQTRLDVAATDNVVAFEVDSFDPRSRTGWCVVVTGVARRLDDPKTLDELDAFDLPAWSTDIGECVLAISTDVVSGERIHPPADATSVRTDRWGSAEVLSLDECWALLAADEVGRLAIIRGDTPVVTPINYVVDDGTIVFRTDPGTKFHQGPRSKVSFEIDGLDHVTQSGWSVIATGFLDEITEYDAAVFDRVRRLQIQPWAGGEKRHVMRLVPSSVSGRRVGSSRLRALAANSH
jgi:nitroimidazol reductase NimA-like FMN-containing flavoprotein (pyridoxamine 5'-phosphate oxidase superfamily)